MDRCIGWSNSFVAALIIKLTDDSGLQINKDSPGDMLASTSLREEGVEGVVAAPDGLVRGHLAIRLNAMLEAVELPATISDLGPGLADVDGDALTLKKNDERVS